MGEAGRVGRRGVLVAGSGALIGAAAPAGARESSPFQAEMRKLEREHGATVGAFAWNVRSGAVAAHRAHRRFPLLSVFKPLAAGAVLRDLDRHGEVLGKRVRWSERDVVEYSPITGKHLETGLTVAELCEAAICYSDNTAGNMLLRELGGPTAVTRFCRSLGDPVTRLDRWETELNSAEPWRRTDTTSPYAVARDYARLALSGELEPADRRRFTRWLLDNTTGDARIRAGLPADWTVGDKTGTSGYGTANDVGIAWDPDGTPVVLAVLTRKSEPGARPSEPLIARSAALLADAVMG
jgi:beta-lactamase class A